MEKYGFVYIWYDRKHKRYYVGCHWGSEDDGYICSSRWMLQAYKRRPCDFKRRVIVRLYSNRKELHEQEFYFLSMIKSHELGKKYYNIKNHHFGHWLVDEQKNITVREKISNTLKEKYRDPEYYAKYRESVTKRDKSYLTPEFLKRRGELIKRSRLISSPIELRYLKPGYNMKYNTRAVRGSELDKQRKSASHKKYLESQTEEQKQEFSQKVSQGQLGKPKTGKAAKGHHKSEEHKNKIAESNKLNRKLYPENTCAGKLWWTDGINNKRAALRPEEGWYRGKTNNVKSYNKESTKLVWEKRKKGILPMPNYAKDRV